MPHEPSRHRLSLLEEVHDDKSDKCRAHEAEVGILRVVEKTRMLLPGPGNAGDLDLPQAWIELAGGSLLIGLVVMLYLTTDTERVRAEATACPPIAVGVVGRKPVRKP